MKTGIIALTIIVLFLIHADTNGTLGDAIKAIH